jgi:cytochrome c oxidase assembly factor 2
MCPAPGEENESKEDGLGRGIEEGGMEDGGMEGKGEKRVVKRECPVPKPGGIVGEILGFKSSSGEKGSKPP